MGSGVLLKSSGDGMVAKPCLVGFIHCISVHAS